MLTANFPKSSKPHGIFSLLCWLTLFFIITQLIFAIINNFTYIKTAAILHQQIDYPAIIIPGIVLCIATFLALHLIFTFFIWVIARIQINFWSLTQTTANNLTVSIWALGIITIMVANEYYYPISQFSQLFSEILPLFLAGYCLVFLAIVWSVIVIACYAQLLYLKPKSTLMVSVLITILASIGYHWQQSKSYNQYIAPRNKPNVIIIGLDSLRPDHTGIIDKMKNSTPHIDKFLKSATIFGQALTPLGRTFPAWVSILTGDNPLHNGARFNLTAPKRLNLRHNLAQILQQQGYYTIYATDDKRFSNIDKQYNFDMILGPKIGLNDFILGTFNDFPLPNLLVNTALGPIFYPYNAGNRQALKTYYPATFNRMVESALKRQWHQPLFLGIHFCLPHYPYGWSKKLNYPLPPASSKAARYLYQQAVRRVDQQFGQFVNFLKHNNLLQHSIVIVMSDHGEALGNHDGLTHPRDYQASASNPSSPYKQLLASYNPPFAVDFAAGHGTNVLSMKQYHVLLAFRLFHYRHNISHTYDFHTSLIDIKPSILNLLKLPIPAVDGVSLAPYILRLHKTNPKPRYFYLESGFTPQAVMSVHPNQPRLVSESLHYFTVNPKNGHVIIKNSMAQLIMTSKEYAIVHGHWLLALYPGHQKAVIPVIVNLNNDHWSDRLNSAFARKSPARTLFKQLKLYYGKEIHYTLPKLNHQR